MDSYRDQAAKGWFGYGTWSAPYWFVGMEPGGEQDASEFEAWHNAGGPELIDLFAHSEACHNLQWVCARPPLQRTWKQLIRVVLGYEGKPGDTEAVRSYQRDRLGRSEGETALIDLSAIAAPNLGVIVPEREQNRPKRIEMIRQRMSEHNPKFVLFYGVGYRDDYSKVAGAAFDEDGFAWCGETLCSLVQHPVARPTRSAEWWADKGLTLRTIRTNRSPANAIT
jgi:hypothetical protein